MGSKEAGSITSEADRRRPSAVACDPPRQSSFWDLVSPDQAAWFLIKAYGPAAALAAARCNLAAYEDGRDEDYRFWYAVVVRLHTQSPRPAASVLARLPE